MLDKILPYSATCHRLYQRTLSDQVSVTGVGFYSGRYSGIQIEPAPSNTGIVFIVEGQEIPAHIACVQKETLHTTSLAINGVRIRTVEHLLSAFYGLHIDNAIVRVISGQEIPIVTSTNAKDYVDLILEAGIDDQEAPIEPIIIRSTQSFGLQNSWAILQPSTERSLKVTVEIGFPEPIGTQKFTYINDSPSKYCQEICWARNYLTENVSNLMDDGRTYWQFKRSQIRILPQDPFESPIPCFDHGVWISQPFQENEPVRHKVLDFIGDLSLAGRPVWGNIYVHFPWHVFNHELVKFILGITK